ncbi:ABC transporter permease subunit [Candidatus Poribacteria bacterium]|nr:ABC transporter permease subunit [Candidatus Poribacteria bacterium]
MRNIWTIFLKEIHTYFVSPVAYFVLFVFVGITGFLFSSSLIIGGINRMMTTEVLNVTFLNMSVTLLFFAPVMTMKLFAEEKRLGTIELLMTSPVRDVEVVLGKYLAGFALLLLMLALTLAFPMITSFYGRVDVGPVISGYVGLILLGASFLSIGILVSSMTKNQIVSALTSFGVLLLLWVIGFIARGHGRFGDVLRYLSLVEHFDDFARGVIGLKHVIYYLSVTILSLFATVRSVESSKWR